VEEVKGVTEKLVSLQRFLVKTGFLRCPLVKALPSGYKCTEVSKAAGERWKALSEEDKKPYAAEYQQLKAKFEAEMKEWKDAKGTSGDADDDEEEGEEEEEASSPQKPEAKKAKASPKKRAAKDAKVSAESPPAKTAKVSAKAKKAAASEGPAIPAEILEKAKKAKLDGALTNLASRQDIADKNISADKLLDALQKSGGLVNKARATLMGA